LLGGRDEAQALVKWVAGLAFPEFERDYTFVALRHEDEYPFNEGRLRSNRGLDIAISEYDEHFIEEHVAHSNALHSQMKGLGAYFVGPLARYNLNFDRLSPLAKDAATAAGLGSTCNNPFKSIIVRAVETLYAFDEAIRLIDAYEMPDHPAVEVPARAGVGYGCTEAPRGICYHRYKIDEKGLIADAKIVPPTSQNQQTIEADLRDIVPKYIDLDEAQLTWRCEQAVRNYDPCISCATHFLRLKIERE
jgi:coenzyme F420-reducing hydrogenase alpha subunit